MQIYRIYFSAQDGNQLAGKETPTKLVDEVDFSKVVVDKPWGLEYLMYRNSFAQVWCLHIRGNEITSMHCHPNKKTSLILLEGEAVFSTLNTSVQLKPCDSLVIDPGVFHSTRALPEVQIRVLEIETPPLKYDLVRLKDEYGRVGTFYEGSNKMHCREEGCLRIPELRESACHESEYYKSKICVRKIRATYSVLDEKLLREYDVIVVLEGTIYSRKGQILYTVADVISPSDYLNNLNSHVVTDLTLMLVKYKGTP